MNLRYFVERLGWAAFVLFGSTIVIFAILHVIPGDPARAMLGPEGTPEAIAKLPSLP